MAPTEPPRMGHEPDAIQVRSVLLSLGGLGVFVAAAAALMWGLFHFLAVDARSEDRAMPDNVAGAIHRLPPQPRLEARPLALRTRLNASENAQLTTYGWIDRKAGTVHVPIARAIDLLAERGIAATATAPAASPVQGAAAPLKPLPPGGAR